eukprot:2779786-Alexandrium_andersonii.AAC.1
MLWFAPRAPALRHLRWGSRVWGIAGGPRPCLVQRVPHGAPGCQRAARGSRSASDAISWGAEA